MVFPQTTMPPVQAASPEPGLFKILLIHPPNEFMKEAYGIAKKVRFGHAPPMGIGYVAAYLQRDGHDVQILDASALQLSLEETVARVEAMQPAIVGLSVLTNYAESAKTLAQAIKEKCPSVTVVLGGPHATYFHESVLRDMPAVDHVVYGEADRVVSDYVRAHKDPDALSRLKGVVFRNRLGEVVVTPPATDVENLDEIPMPAWLLYDMSLYRPLPFQYRRMPFFTMITSRGCCWGKCKFCFQAGRHKAAYRRHSVQRVIGELEILYRQYGVREIAFWDDTFVMTPRWLDEFCAQLKAKSLDISWVASGRVNQMNEGMLQTIRQAGCWSIFIGVESGNQDLLNSIDKGITLDQCRNIFKATKRIGIQTRGAFMLGLPGETPEKGRKTIDFALELDPTYAIFYATHPRFGTQLYDIASAQGAFISKQFKGMSKITYVPEGYRDAEELAGVVRCAYRRYYWRPRYWLRVLRNIRSFSDLLELIRSFVLYLGLADSR